MRRFLYSLLTAILLLTSCASIPEDTGEVEVISAGNRTFIWRGKLLSIQDLTYELSTLDKTQPVTRINLRSGASQTTMADVLVIAVLARTLGAAPFVENDGKLQPVTLEITE